MHSTTRQPNYRYLCLILLVMLSMFARQARSQVITQATPAQKPATQSREAALEARIRELEQQATTRSSREIQLEQRLKALESLIAKDPAALKTSATQTQAPPIDLPGGEEALVQPGIDAVPAPNPSALQPDYLQNTITSDLPPGFDVPELAPQTGTPPLADRASAATKAPDIKVQMPFSPKSQKGYASVGQGFLISTNDDEYQLQIHNLSQFELRQYNNPNMSPTHSTFGFPRQWLIFNGRLTKPIEYYVALNWGFTNLNLLDIFLNFHYDDRLQLKIGRFKTPWSYEFYNEPVTGLINPERSMFFNNYGPNRDLGVMLWGQIFDKTSDYAVGVFNGIRNGFIDTNNAKNAIAYLNFRPFEKSNIDPLKYWNVGGSVSYNVYNGVARPELFRTNVPYPGDANVSPLWLELNKNVWEFGTQNIWSLHSAWYYNSLSLIAEWYSGYETYAYNASLMKGTHVPTAGWYVQSGYFLTGEHVTSRGMVEPLRPFNPKNWSGLGAWELAFRWANQSMDKSIFNFASESKWTNDTNVVDLGLNWHWNYNLKFYMGWQRAMFGEPIQAAPGVPSSGPPKYWMSSSDMLWLRAQWYY